MNPSHRGSIFVEDAVVLTQMQFEAGQYIMRVEAPKCAAAARPGSFAHVVCHPAIPMRRPLSIMRVSATDGWVEFLYKIVGSGLQHLASRRPGESINMLGPIGKPFELHDSHRRPLLIGGGVGIPPMVFLAEELAADTSNDWQVLALMGSEVPFPFDSLSSKNAVKGIPEGVSACMPLLESWGVASRLASLSGFPGCHRGLVTELADLWLDSLDQNTRQEVEIFACGPTPMLQAAAALARRHGVPCQVSLEEFMACAVGGCAGCTVLVRADGGTAMKRVCVDGPVFDATQVFGPGRNRG